LRGGGISTARIEEYSLPVRKAIVTAGIGLHARPAAEFVRAVNGTGLPVTISKAGGDPVDARSLLEVMTADFDCGCEVELGIAEEALPAERTLAEAEDALGGLAELLAAQAAQAPTTPATP
jgi:phosphocarrier protein HPr